MNDRVVLPRPWRQSLPSKVVAVGFDLCIVVGNIWLALALVGAPIGTWAGVAFVASLLLAAGGGVMLAVRQVLHLLAVHPQIQRIFKRIPKNS